MALSISQNDFDTPYLYSSKARVTISCLLAIIGIAIFSLMYIEIKTKGTFHSLDTSVLNWLIARRNPGMTQAMKIVTTIFAPLTFAVAITLLALVWAAIKREFKRPLLLIGGMGVAFITSSVIKTLVHRTRPPFMDMIHPLETDYSFPSGHTLGITVFVLVLGYLLYSRRPSLYAFVVWLVATVVSIFIVAFSRLYLGYHWLTDVSASVGLGLILLAAVIVVDIFLDRLGFNK